MNLNRKSSAGKPPPAQKEHLQTLPCESFQRTFEEDFQKHTGSVSVEFMDLRKDFLMPASPTFPNDQLSQLSYPGLSEKENRPLLMNKQGHQRSVMKERSLSPGCNNLPPATLHESRLLRGANMRLEEKITELESEVKRLKMMLSESQKALEKKLKEDFKYLDFFKATNSSERGHVDIYLELVALTNLLETNQKNHDAALQLMQSKMHEMERKQLQKHEVYEREVRTFEAAIDKLNSKCEQQKKELQQVEELRTQLVSYEKELMQKDRELETTTNYLKECREEVERCRQLPKRIKELEDECKAKQIQLKEVQTNFAEVEKEYELVSLENEKNKESNRKIEKRLEAAVKEKEKLGRLLEEEKEYLVSLKQEAEELESSKIKLNKELLRMGNDLKALRIQSELQKQMTTQRELGELEGLRCQIDQLKLRLERERLEHDRLESKCNHMEQENHRLSGQISELVRESNKEIEFARAESDRVRSELEKELIQAKQSLNDLKRRLTEMDSECRRDSQLHNKYSSKHNRDDYFFNNESRIQTIDKYQSNNGGPFRTDSRLASKLKEILRSLRETLPKYDSIRMKRPPLGSGMTSPSTTSSQEELESYANEISVLVSSLMLLEQKEGKENELLRERVEAYQKERESMEQDKTFEIGLKEEAIKKLIQFVPSQCIDLVSDYLFVVEEMSTRCTNEHLQDKADLLNQLTQQAYAWRDRYRHLEDVDRRFTQLKQEHEQLRRLLTVSESKRCELAELGKRDIKKKYFEQP